MHLVPCLECGKPISNEVFACPHCKMPTQTGIKKNAEMGNAEFSIQAPLFPCIACKKEVEETSIICPYCGTRAPKRILLTSCRICGEEVGKSAPSCPHCKSLTPNKAKLFRKNLIGYLSLILSFFLFFTIFNESYFSNEKEFFEIIILFGIFFLFHWSRCKDLKDLSG